MVASLVASFIRKVPTASGARAVQIVHKQGRQVVGIEPYSTQSSDTKRMSQLRALAAANPPVEQAPLRACDPGEPGYTWGPSPVD